MPDQITPLPCACGQSALQVHGTPLINAECLCTDCQNAGAFLQSLPGAKPVLDHHGATRFVLYRKDRVCCVKGAELLRAHRLSKNASTRRVVARCCNTPMFLDFSGGHWLSIYGGLWPAGTLPALDLRTMTRSKPEGWCFRRKCPILARTRFPSMHDHSGPGRPWAFVYPKWIGSMEIWMRNDDDKITIENIDTPGRVERVDRAKYLAMKEALISVLPRTAPGMTGAEVKIAILPLLPQALFPEGAKAGWWLKATQLDLEAKGLIQRENTNPLRLRRLS
jgi:hypothetical protein